MAETVEHGRFIPHGQHGTVDEATFGRMRRYAASGRFVELDRYFIPEMRGRPSFEQQGGHTGRGDR